MRRQAAPAGAAPVKTARSGTPAGVPVKIAHIANL